jgi:hypothetical protein
VKEILQADRQGTRMKSKEAVIIMFINAGFILTQVSLKDSCPNKI